MRLSRKKRKILIKTLKRFFLVVLASVFVGVSAYSVNASKLAGDTVPMPFGVGAAVVLSGSMEPTFSTGDILVVVKSRSFKVGDIVIYQTGRTAVSHKIVSIDGNTVVTKGEANNTEDDPITVDQIKGKVLFAIPGMGAIIDWIRTPLGTFIIIGLALFLLERSYKTERKQEDKDVKALKTEIDELKKRQNRH